MHSFRDVGAFALGPSNADGGAEEGAEEDATATFPTVSMRFHSVELQTDHPRGAPAGDEARARRRGRPGPRQGQGRRAAGGGTRRRPRVCPRRRGTGGRCNGPADTGARVRPRRLRALPRGGFLLISEFTFPQDLNLYSL